MGTLLVALQIVNTEIPTALALRLQFTLILRLRQVWHPPDLGTPTILSGFLKIRMSVCCCRPSQKPQMLTKKL